jgi:hypothetical protein
MGQIPVASSQSKSFPLNTTKHLASFLFSNELFLGNKPPNLQGPPRGDGVKHAFIEAEQYFASFSRKRRRITLIFNVFVYTVTRSIL